MMLGKACLFFCQCSLGVFFFEIKNFRVRRAWGGKKMGDPVDKTSLQPI